MARSTRRETLFDFEPYVPSESAEPVTPVAHSPAGWSDVTGIVVSPDTRSILRDLEAAQTDLRLPPLRQVFQFPWQQLEEETEDYAMFSSSSSAAPVAVLYDGEPGQAGQNVLTKWDSQQADLRSKNGGLVSFSDGLSKLKGILAANSGPSDRVDDMSRALDSSLRTAMHKQMPHRSPPAAFRQAALQSAAHDPQRQRHFDALAEEWVPSSAPTEWCVADKNSGSLVPADSSSKYEYEQLLQAPLAEYGFGPEEEQELQQVRQDLADARGKLEASGSVISQPKFPRPLQGQCPTDLLQMDGAGFSNLLKELKLETLPADVLPAGGIAALKPGDLLSPNCKQLVSLVVEPLQRRWSEFEFTQSMQVELRERINSLREQQLKLQSAQRDAKLARAQAAALRKPQQANTPLHECFYSTKLGRYVGPQEMLLLYVRVGFEAAYGVASVLTEQDYLDSRMKPGQSLPQWGGFVKAQAKYHPHLSATQHMQVYLNGLSDAKFKDEMCIHMDSSDRPHTLSSLVAHVEGVAERRMNRLSASVRNMGQNHAADAAALRSMQHSLGGVKVEPSPRAARGYADQTCVIHPTGGHTNRMCPDQQQRAYRPGQQQQQQQVARPPRKPFRASVALAGPAVMEGEDDSWEQGWSEGDGDGGGSSSEQPSQDQVNAFAMALMQGFAKGSKPIPSSTPKFGGGYKPKAGGVAQQPGLGLSSSSSSNLPRLAEMERAAVKGKHGLALPAGSQEQCELCNVSHYPFPCFCHFPWCARQGFKPPREGTPRRAHFEQRVTTMPPGVQVGALFLDWWGLHKPSLPAEVVDFVEEQLAKQRVQQQYSYGSRMQGKVALASIAGWDQDAPSEDEDYLQNYEFRALTARLRFGAARAEVAPVATAVAAYLPVHRQSSSSAWDPPAHPGGDASVRFVAAGTPRTFLPTDPTPRDPQQPASAAPTLGGAEDSAKQQQQQAGQQTELAEVRQMLKGCVKVLERLESNQQTGQGEVSVVSSARKAEVVVKPQLVQLKDQPVAALTALRKLRGLVLQAEQAGHQSKGKQLVYVLKKIQGGRDYSLDYVVNDTPLTGMVVVTPDGNMHLMPGLALDSGCCICLLTAAAARAVNWHWHDAPVTLVLADGEESRVLGLAEPGLLGLAVGTPWETFIPVVPAVIAGDYEAYSLIVDKGSQHSGEMTILHDQQLVEYTAANGERHTLPIRGFTQGDKQAGVRTRFLQRTAVALLRHLQEQEEGQPSSPCSEVASSSCGSERGVRLQVLSDSSDDADRCSSSGDESPDVRFCCDLRAVNSHQAYASYRSYPAYAGSGSTNSSGSSSSGEGFLSSCSSSGSPLLPVAMQQQLPERVEFAPATMPRVWDAEVAWLDLTGREPWQPGVPCFKHAYSSHAKCCRLQKVHPGQLDTPEEVCIYARCFAAAGVLHGVENAHSSSLSTADISALEGRLEQQVRGDWLDEIEPPLYCRAVAWTGCTAVHMMQLVWCALLATGLSIFGCMPEPVMILIRWLCSPLFSLGGRAAAAAAAFWAWCWPEPKGQRRFSSWRHYNWWQQRELDRQQARPYKASRKRGRWRRHKQPAEQRPAVCKKLTTARRFSLLVLSLLLMLLTCAVSVNASPESVLATQVLTGSIAALEWSRIPTQHFRLVRPGSA